VTTITKSTVLLVDDHPLLRQGLARLIDQAPDLAVCGEAEDAAGALEMVRTLRPDVAVVDMTLRDRKGVELVKELAAAHRGLKMLVLSMHDESLHAERALQAGARGYVMKQEAPHLVLAALRKVLAGEIYLSERMNARVLQRLVGGPKADDAAPPSPVEVLSGRELEIYALLGQGLATREIASRLGVGVKTVDTYRERIKDKLKLRTAAELLRSAMRFSEDA
jgi:DNA-binding NarL/FixJ family response regulator